jgi:hypothetical protein
MSSHEPASTTAAVLKGRYNLLELTYDVPMKVLGPLPAVLSLLVCAFPVPSQTFQAQITGEVRDASGAVVPNVKLTATNQATNVSFETQPNEEGIYRFLALPPAQYNLSAPMTGFETHEQGPIPLQVNDNVTLNVTLQLGDAAERVVVTAASEALQTSNATEGQVVTTRTIEGLPLNVRDPLAVVGLTPGVTFGAVNSHQFGTVTRQANTSRQFQFALKIAF